MNANGVLTSVDQQYRPGTSDGVATGRNPAVFKTLEYFEVVFERKPPLGTMAALVCVQ
jgi:hypothetical protein